MNRIENNKTSPKKTKIDTDQTGWLILGSPGFVEAAVYIHYIAITFKPSILGNHNILRYSRNGLPRRYEQNTRLDSKLAYSVVRVGY